MANLGTLSVYVSQHEQIVTSTWTATTGGAATLRASKIAQRRPVAWWRGGKLQAGSVGTGVAQNNPDQIYTLNYPDNGRLAGLTEVNLARDGYVKVAVFYIPTMQFLGWTKSDVNGNFNIGYTSFAPLALDTTDSANYAAIAFDPSKTYNLVGFDDLSAVA